MTFQITQWPAPVIQNDSETKASDQMDNEIDGSISKCLSICAGAQVLGHNFTLATSFLPVYNVIVW